MQPRYKALFVHLLTATGAVLSMFALLAAVENKWSIMFLWLVIALIIDGIDGPLARRYDVVTNWPRYDGVLLDLIVDFLTYAFIPAYALFKSGLLTGWNNWFAIIIIVYGSVLYFSDTYMKTEDKSFSGFPACWNMVILVLFAVKPPEWLIMGIIISLAITMFFPLRFIHPTRTKRWRAISLPVSIGWIVCAAWATFVDFDVTGTLAFFLVVSSLWLTLAGIIQQCFPTLGKSNLKH